MPRAQDANTFRRAVQLWSAGSLREAEPMLNELVADDPSFGEAWLVLGHVRLGLRRNSELAWRRASSAGQPEASYALGLSLAQAGRAKDGLGLLRHACRLNPHERRYAVGLTDLLLLVDEPPADLGDTLLTLYDTPRIDHTRLGPATWRALAQTALGAEALAGQAEDGQLLRLLALPLTEAWLSRALIIDATWERLLTGARAARSLIGSLNTDILSYKTKIETLEGETIILTQEKNMVTQQRDKVLRDLDSAKGIISQKDEVIDVASTLHASNFSILGINEKASGKEKTTTGAKRVDKLRISFEIDENRTATSGTKYICVCVFAPDGNPVAVESLGSGKFNTRDGKEKTFTQKIDVNYTQGQRQTLSIDLKQASSFATGDYKIEVYNNGFKIGEGIRSLKKGGIFS